MPSAKKAEAASEQAVLKMDQAHLVSLKKLVVDFTKAGHIEQALAAQAKVDEHTAMLNAVAPPQQAAVAQESEKWKKKAQEEYPTLKDPASPLSKRLKALMEMKKATPSYF